MSLVQEILYIVSNYPGGYRVIYDLIYDGKPPGEDFDRRRKNILSATLSRMKKNGLLKSKDRDWFITPEGVELLGGINENIRRFFPRRVAKNRNRDKRIIVIFDIPETEKRYREWLRSELVSFGFEMIQKSVWFGPALPKEFIEYLSEIKLLNCIRFFKATEKDLI